MIYPDFQVAIQAGKNITSHLPAEIYTKTGTLTLNAVAAINQARFVSYSGEVIDLPIRPAHTNARRGGSLCPAIAHQKPSAYLEWLQTAEQVHETSTRCVKALEYNLRMKKNERTISTKLERSARNTPDLIHSLKFRNKSSPLSMKEKMSSGSVLPVLVRLSPTSFRSLLKLKPKKAQQLLILAPNTELAGQILMSPSNGQSLLGSRPNSSCQDPVKNGKSNVSKRTCKFLIGTPGRIFELIKLKKDQNDECGNHHFR